MAGDGLPMARKGVVQITVGGKITHNRRERPKQPGQWNVTLADSHSAPWNWSWTWISKLRVVPSARQKS